MFRSAAARRIALTVLVLLTPAVSHAQYNLSADFSTLTNPNGVWSFGSRAVNNLFSASLSVYSTSITAGGWEAHWTDAGNLPGVFKNISNTVPSSGTVQGIAAGMRTTG